jgi:hypothetical protein
MSPTVFTASVLLVIFSFFLIGRSSPLVAIISYIYDEHDILPYFLEYHSKIFGLENIAIIDNNSPESTAAILKTWEAKGLRVIRNTEDYLYKGKTTYQAFKDYFPDAKFALPLDADEFLVSLNEKHQPFFPSRQKIHDRIARMWNSSFINFRYHTIFEDCNMFGNESIQHDQYFFPTLFQSKKMFKFKYLTLLDHGGHHGVYPKGISSVQNGSVAEYFGLLHFRNRNLNRKLKLQRAMKTLEGLHLLNQTVDGADNSTIHRDTVEDFLKHHNPAANRAAVEQLLKNPKTRSVHKASDVANFLKDGLFGVTVDCPANKYIKLPTVEEMIGKY